MGIGIGVFCSNCIYYAEFYLGIGMAYGSFEEIVSELPSKTMRTDIQEIIRNHQITDRFYGNAIMHCRECNCLDRRFMIAVTYDDGQVYETPHHCEKCGSPLEAISVEDLTETPCPSCGEKTLSSRISCYWD